MSSDSGARRGARLLGGLALSCVSSLVAIAVGVEVFSRWVEARRERELLAQVQQLGVGADTFNIYYFGSSTMAGEPYQPEASIPRIVAALLDGEVAGRSIHSVNLARAGTDFAYSLERVRQVVQNRDASHPSLAVIYGGHNEFLKFEGRASRLFARWPAAYVELAQRLEGLLSPLEIDERHFPDTAVVSAAERRAVFDRYGSELREATALLSANGIPTIVSTLASNDADWEPNRSVSCGDAGTFAELERRMDRGREAESRGDLRAALAAYTDALALCGSVAEIHFRMGSCHRRLQEPEPAWDAFQKARDEDGMPIRAASAINDAIRSLDDGGLVTSVDAVARLRARSADGLIGFDLMVDAHHPNWKGYVLISELIAEEICRRFPSTGKQVRTVEEAKLAALFGIDAGKQFEVAISRGRWFTRLATWRHDPRDRLDRADEQFRRASDLDPSRYDSYLGLAMVAFLRGDAEAGEKQVARARSLNASAVDRYLEGRWVRRVRERAHGLAGAGRSVTLGRAR